MNNQVLKSSLQEIYANFISDLEIDPKTGILGRISNSRYQEKLGTIRFSGYPFIGSQYELSSPKILVVGLDTGVDEREQENTYHNFDSRNQKTEPRTQDENEYGPHMSGTYGMLLFLLKDIYGCTEFWDKYFKDRDETFKTIVDQSGRTILPYDVLSHVAITNLHKFVTIGRPEGQRSGSKNRKWYNPKEEKEFFKAEVGIFAPEIVYIQGQSGFDRKLLDFLKKEGYRLVLSDHPSSWKNGANKPTYVNKLKYVNW